MCVPKEVEARADALWKFHGEWMKKTHVSGGAKKCLFYHVCPCSGVSRLSPRTYRARARSAAAVGRPARTRPYPTARARFCRVDGSIDSTLPNATTCCPAGKSAAVDDFAKGPGASRTGNVNYTIVEFYENKAGLDNHFAMFHASHECEWFVKEFGEILGLDGVTFTGAGYGKTFITHATGEYQASYAGFDATLARAK